MVALKRTSDPTVHEFSPSRKPTRRFYRYIRRKMIAQSLNKDIRSRLSGYEAFSDCRTSFGTELLGQINKPDIINLHWVANFLDYSSFFTSVALTTIPVVWTLHDMNPFTGGCHYDIGCGKYEENCGACPQLGSNDPNDISYKIWRRKHTLFEKICPELFTIVTPSQWLAEKSRASSLLQKFPVKVIPNGLDIKEFAPRDKKISRKTLGLPPDAKVILFISDVVGNKRKGFIYLNKALTEMQHLENLFLMISGREGETINTTIPYRYLGRIADSRMLSMVYSAADVFVVPSLQDNLPNTVLESMACGTPVVGFKVGGLPDMVRYGETGVLAEPENVDSLRNAIVHLITCPDILAVMSVNCRKVVVEEYSQSVQALKYMALYRHLIDLKQSQRDKNAFSFNG